MQNQNTVPSGIITAQLSNELKQFSKCFKIFPAALIPAIIEKCDELLQKRIIVCRGGLSQQIKGVAIPAYLSWIKKN